MFSVCSQLKLVPHQAISYNLIGGKRLKVYLKIAFFFFVSLVIRGDKEERAVLCSGDKTYDLKIADTSNLLLFVPGCKTPDQLSDGQNGPHVVHNQVSKWQPQ